MAHALFSPREFTDFIAIRRFDAVQVAYEKIPAAAFSIEAAAAGNLDVTLVNCRSFGNVVGVSANGANSTGTTTVRIANCVITGNHTGIISSGSATSLLGTNPGTNFISGNTADGTTTGSVTLANWIPTPWEHDRLPSKSDLVSPAPTLAGSRRRSSESRSSSAGRRAAASPGTDLLLARRRPDQRPSEAVAYRSGNRRTILTKERL